MRTNYLHEILSHPQSSASPYCSPCLASPTCPTLLPHLFLNCNAGELCVCEKSVVIDTELYANRINVSLSPVLKDAAEADETARRLQAMPGIGPITASIPVATPPDMSAFRPARDLSAWPGLTPKPHASGGKERVGTISMMGAAPATTTRWWKRSARPSSQS